MSSYCLRLAGWLCFSLILAPFAQAATVPYFEDFESYALGDTAVTNFTELSTTAWTIVSPSIAGQGYQDAISATAPTAFSAAGENSSSAISFPALSSSAFSISTQIRIDTLTLTGTGATHTNTADIGLFARGADLIPALSGSDRYQVDYFLNDDGVSHPMGHLFLTEFNSIGGDGLHELSTSSLPIVLGDTYQLMLTGTPSGGSLSLSATLTNLNTSSSISVSATDTANLLSGAGFGYINSVHVNSTGTTALNADFDNFSAIVPEPATWWGLATGLVTLAFYRRRVESDRWGKRVILSRGDET